MTTCIYHFHFQNIEKSDTEVDFPYLSPVINNSYQFKYSETYMEAWRSTQTQLIFLMQLIILKCNKLKY